MTINVDAVYEDGVLKPERPLALKEKAKVHVTIETFVTSLVWQSGRGRFAASLRAESMPGALLGAFSEISDPESRVVAVLRLVSPIGAGAARAF